MSDKDKRGVEYEGTIPLETVVSYLEDLSSRLASGEVQVANGASSVLLLPNESVHLKVRAREKDGEQSLRFEMAWERSEPAPVSTGLSFTSRNGEAPEAHEDPETPPITKTRARPSARSKSRSSGRGKRTTRR